MGNKQFTYLLVILSIAILLTSAVIVNSSSAHITEIPYITTRGPSTKIVPAQTTQNLPLFMEPIHGPKTGLRKVLVVFVYFSNVEPTKDINDIIKVLNYVQDYFNEITYGKVVINFTIINKWFQLPKDLEYYGKPPAGAAQGDDPGRVKEFFIDTLNVLLDEGIDVFNYHTILIVHAGRDEAYSKVPSDILSEATTGEALIILDSEERKYLAFATVSEFDGLNVYVHELLHNYGFPDLYDYERERIFVGYWCVMAEGSRLDPPPHPLGILKYYVEWIEDEEVATLYGRSGRWYLVFKNSTKFLITNTSLTLRIKAQEVGEKGLKLLIIPINQTHFVTLEIRLRIGYDATLSNEGLLIYLVDTTKTSGHGPIRVLDTKPETLTLSDAALGIGEEYLLNITTPKLKIRVINCSESECLVEIIEHYVSKEVPKVLIKYLAVERNESHVGNPLGIKVWVTYINGTPVSNALVIMTNNVTIEVDEEGIGKAVIKEGTLGIREYRVISVIDLKTFRELRLVNNPSAKVLWYKLRVEVNISKTHLNIGEHANVCLRIIRLGNASLEPRRDVILEYVKNFMFVNSTNSSTLERYVVKLDGYSHPLCIPLASDTPAKALLIMRKITYFNEVIDPILIETTYRVDGYVYYGLLSELPKYTIVFDEVAIYDVNIDKKVVDVGTPITVSFKAKYVALNKYLSNIDLVLVNGVPAKYLGNGSFKVSLVSYEPTVEVLRFSVNTADGITAISAPKDVKLIWDLIMINLSVTKDRVDLCRNINEVITIRGRYLAMGEDFEGDVILNKPPCKVGVHVVKPVGVHDYKYGLSKFISNEVRIAYDYVVIKLSCPKNTYLIGSKPKVFIKAYYALDKKELKGNVEINLTEPIMSEGTYTITVTNISDHAYGLKYFRVSNPCVITFSKPELLVRFNDLAFGVRVDIKLRYLVNKELVTDENVSLIINGDEVAIKDGMASYDFRSLSPVITLDLRVVNNGLIIHEESLTHINVVTLMLHLLIFMPLTSIIYILRLRRGKARH
ncbi:MAG: hypothetical protein DRO18_01825 [Thermoprotei archaeon]|nr:MAG: hypothetical protein DRO18_01825 [Thermoprotei archaeon]